MYQMSALGVYDLNVVIEGEGMFDGYAQIRNGSLESGE